ncbi:hypothetical protein H4R33_001440 [Dimargaris cristalligena]|nr:hypothetical protein H4R33_001440 [Dimargaris cristalligena]
MASATSYASDSSVYEDALSAQGDTIDQVLALSPRLAPRPGAPEPPTATLGRLTRRSSVRRDSTKHASVSLPQMLDNFGSGAREVELWLEAAKVYLESIDIRAIPDSNRSCLEFAAMMKDFTPTMELLCELGDSIQSRIERIQASLPPDEQALRDQQANQAKVLLHRILADWKIINLNFGHIKKQLLEAQYADELYAAIYHMQTDIRQYVGSVEAFERQWTATHAPCVSPAHHHYTSESPAPVVATSKSFLGIATEKIQRQEDHALARLHQQVASFEPRLQHLRTRVSKFISIQLNHLLPTDSPFLTFQEFYDVVVREWEDLRDHLELLKRRVISERWVYIFEDLSAEIAADMNNLVHLVQDTRGDIIKVKSTASDSRDLRLGIEAVRSNFYQQRHRPLQTVTKLFRHLATSYDKEVLKQRKPGLVRHYHDLQQTWYEVQEGLCHLEAELNHIIGSPGSQPTSSVSSTDTDSVAILSTVGPLIRALEQYRISEEPNRQVVSPPLSPVSGPTSVADSSSPPGTLAPRKSAPTVPRSLLPRPKTPNTNGPPAPTPLTRKSFDASMGSSSRAVSSLEVRRCKTPSLLPRPKTPQRSRATSPSQGYPSQPVPALPIQQRMSPPGDRAKSRATTPVGPTTAYGSPTSLANRMLESPALPRATYTVTLRGKGGGATSSGSTSRSRTPGASSPAPATPSYTDTDSPAITVDGLTNMDVLLTRAKTPTNRLNGGRYSRLLVTPPVLPMSSQRLPRRSVSPTSFMAGLPRMGSPPLHAPMPSLGQALAQSSMTTPSRGPSGGTDRLPPRPRRTSITSSGSSTYSPRTKTPISGTTDRSLSSLILTPNSPQLPLGHLTRTTRQSGSPRIGPASASHRRPIGGAATDIGTGTRSTTEEPTSDILVALANLPQRVALDTKDSLDTAVAKVVAQSPVPISTYRIQTAKYYFGLHHNHELLDSANPGSSSEVGKLAHCRLRSSSLTRPGREPTASQRRSEITPSDCPVQVFGRGSWQDLDLFLLDLSISTLPTNQLPSSIAETTSQLTVDSATSSTAT